MKRYKVYLVSGEETFTIIEINELEGESIETTICSLIECGYSPTYTELKENERMKKMKDLTSKEKEVNTLKALDNFYNAALELLIEWQALDYGDKLETILNDGEGSDYPFEFSFDDIVSRIGSWQGEVEAQMKKKENEEQ